METNEQERALSEALAYAERVEDSVEQVRLRIPTSVVEAALSGMAEDAPAIVANVRRSDRTLKEVVEGLHVLFRGAFCAGYRANEALSGGAEPTPWITDEEREAAFERITENVFWPRYDQEMEGFLIAYSAGMKIGDEKDAYETLSAAYKVGFYLGYKAYEDDD